MASTLRNSNGALPAPLQRGVEALVDGAVEARCSCPRTESMWMRTTSRPAFASHASWSGASRPARLRSRARRTAGGTSSSAGVRALEQQRQHRHEVRLAAAEAAVDEAPVLLAPVEDLLHVVEDARAAPSRPRA